MKCIAITTIGKEFMYKANTAHKVSERSAKKICDICNSVNWKIKPGEKWYIYDIDMYSMAFEYAIKQDFIIRNGIVKARSVNPF